MGQPIPLAEDIAAMAFVQSSFLCQGVDEHLMAELYSGSVVMEVAAGERVFSEGDTDDALYVVLEGSVNIRKRRREAQLELASLDRQAVFGEIAVLTQKPRTASVVARVDTRLVRLSGDVVRRVAERAPKFGRKLAALMAGRNKDTSKKLGG
jgi:CRP-like cAMP-binding protein